MGLPPLLLAGQEAFHTIIAATFPQSATLGQSMAPLRSAIESELHVQGLQVTFKAPYKCGPVCILFTDHPA